MRRKKPIVLVSIFVVLYLTVIFSGAEQDKRRRVTNHSQKSIYSIKNYFPPQQRYVPGEIIIKLKMPLSDFEIAKLLGEYPSQKISDWRSSQPSARRFANNLYLIRFPENYSAEQMAQFFERNPYVEYAEPNEIVRIPEMPNEPDESFLKKRYPNQKKRIKEVRKKGLHKGIEKTPREGDEK